MADQRRGGFYQLAIDGVQYDAKGECTYNLGRPKNKAIMGANGAVQGFTQEAQAPYVEIKITDRGSLNVANLLDLFDSTVVLSLANGKVVTLRNAAQTGDGDVKTDEAEITVRLEGKSAQELTA